MELKVNISDYMSDDEIKEIIRDTIKQEIKKQTQEDYERIMNNLAYYSKFGFISSILTDDDKEIIKQKTKEIIGNVSRYDVFYNGGYGEEPSLGCKVIREETAKLVPVIKENVRKIVDDKMNYKNLYEKTIGDCFNDAVIGKIGDILCKAAGDNK